MEMQLWSIMSFLVALISGIVIPVYLLLNRKFKSIDKQLSSLQKFLIKVAEKSDTEDQQQNAHWLNYYKNEIIKFMERIRVHPERIPTKEHYQTVFDYFQEYKKLGGNHYIDILMESIGELYKSHHNTDTWPPLK